MRKWREILSSQFSYFVGQAITKSGSDDGNMKCKLFLVGVNWKDDRNLQIGEGPS